MENKKQGYSVELKAKRYASPWRLLWLTIVSVFLAEAFIMVLLTFLRPLSIYEDVLIDAMLLSVLVFPILYLFLFRPMILHIEERKKAEEKLLEAWTAAEDANRLKSEFLANISHEIRTPLNGILGMTSLALSTGVTEEQGGYLDTVKKSSYALLDIINNIIDFSELETGRAELDIEDFSLRQTVGEVINALTEQASEKRLELRHLISNNVPNMLRGDSVRFSQVLLNLGRNAIKFTDKGEVIIRAGLKQEKDNHVTILFSVSDTGVGIPEDKQKLIFDAFVQADGTTTRKYGGTGLGLAIAKKLVTLMNGEIWVESETGKGSRFWFTAMFKKQSANNKGSL